MTSYCHGLFESRDLYRIKQGCQPVCPQSLLPASLFPKQPQTSPEAPQQSSREEHISCTSIIRDRNSAMKFVASLALMGVLFRAQSCVAEETIDSAVRDQLKAAFDRLDINKDGFWSKEELKKELEALDINGDGHVPWEEMKSALENNRNEALNTYAASTIMEAHEEAVIKCVRGEHHCLCTNWTFANFAPGFDANSDGSVSEEEYTNYHMKVFLLNVKGLSTECP